MSEAAKPPTNCRDIAVRILAGVLVLIIATSARALSAKEFLDLADVPPEIE
jgi:hypothetical protein